MTARAFARLLTAAVFTVLIPAAAPQQSSKPETPKPAEAVRSPDDRLDEIVRLSREILKQHEELNRVSEEKIRRLTQLLNDYERRWASSRFSDELRRTQELSTRSVVESEQSMRATSLENQVHRLELQVRDMEFRMQQYQQMLDAKQREIQQLEDRLRTQLVR